MEHKLSAADIGSDSLNPNLTSTPKAGPENHENPIPFAADWFRNQGLNQVESGFSLATVKYVKRGELIWTPHTAQEEIWWFGEGFFSYLPDMNATIIIL